MQFDTCGTTYIPTNVSQCALLVANLYVDNIANQSSSIVGRQRTYSNTSTTTSQVPTASTENIDDVDATTRSTSAAAAAAIGSGLRWDLETVVQLYLISLLIAFGVVANVVSIIVLRQDRERRDTLFLLQALAVADALYLIAAIMRYPVKHLIKTQFDGSNRYVDMQPVVFPLLKTFQVKKHHFSIVILR